MSREAVKEKSCFLPIQQQEYIQSFVQEKDLNAAFFGRLLIDYVLKRHRLQFDWNQFALSKKEKPYFQNADFHFNISHSGEYVVLALHDTTIGIDIEKERNVKIDLFHKQFNTQEFQQIKSSSNPLQQFFHFWSIKEAAIKADGRGVEVLSQTSTLSENTVQVENSLWHYQSLNLIKGYAFAVCTSHPFDLDAKDVKVVRM
ncbi:MAG: 4'-phosphopantetheinyl transferase superfamily protein [Chitinophagales bacterium]|nr:4'-phosphopantetheinyl transferase superfamily protein [Chitinophagales bacterium]